jgi:hypothetical protein
MYDLELVVVVLALRTWQHYLLAVVHIETDHKSLKYIFIQADLNMCQRRWLELMKDYDLEVYYHSEKHDCGCGCLEPQGPQQLLVCCLPH